MGPRVRSRRSFVRVPTSDSQRRSHASYTLNYTYCCELRIRGVSTYSKLTDRDRLFRGGNGGLTVTLLLRVLQLCSLCITYTLFNFSAVARYMTCFIQCCLRVCFNYREYVTQSGGVWNMKYSQKPSISNYSVPSYESVTD